MSSQTRWAFAVVTDQQAIPVAVFSKLEDALEWALARMGSDRFVIRRHPLFTIRPTIQALARPSW